MYLDSLTIVGDLLLAISAAGCLYLVGAGIATHRFSRRARRKTDESPPVSILKPLCGEDLELFDNISSFCRQNYPAWQVVFGVQSPDDPAIPLVRRLMLEFPSADLALVVDTAPPQG